MRLIDAPVIPSRWGFHGRGNQWLRAAADKCRYDFISPPATNRQGIDQTTFPLKQLAEDIWGINGPLGLHTDKTRKGFRVIGLVLVNDPGLVLATGDRFYSLAPGTVYHIDGRAPHGALLSADKDLVNQPDGFFGFMAWDVHRHEDLERLIESIPDSMRAYAAGEERIDVAMDNARTIDEMEKNRG